jgi:LysM repeat protein
MKKTVFCLLPVLTIFVVFACASTPSAPAPASAAGSSSAPAASTPAQPSQQQTQQPSTVAASPSRTTDIILDGSETYTVVRGDTLTKISRSKYRNGFYYPLIIMASNNIVKDQDLIRPGMRLIIPRLQANLDDPRARESMRRFFLETANITERKRPRDAAGLRRLAGSL